jgi:predicted GIY-YIG superfamily endonuclease
VHHRFPLSDCASAPRAPGVYFLRDGRGTLLYVGKASDLRRRLTDHARQGLRGVPRRAIATVSWEVCADEDAAFAREADLIVMLRPPGNASHTEQERDCFVNVSFDGDRATFALTRATDGPGRAYGTFPHVAKGAFSHTAKRSKAGYTALLRLLWLHRDERVPAVLGGGSPPVSLDCAFAPELRDGLHAFLSGRSARVLGPLGNVAVPAFMESARCRDQIAAHEFFVLGPRRLSALRTRHRLPAGPISGAGIAAALAQEISS